MTELPRGWAWATLEDLQAPEERAITDGPFGSNLKSDHYTETGARVIRLQNIGDGVFIDERAYISLEHYETLQQHSVRAGDMVIASLGNELPRACLVPELDAPAIVKADCIRFRPSDAVEAKWILYAMNSPATRAHASERIRGVGRPRLGLNVIRDLPIPVPPIAEQRRIVAALEDHLTCTNTGSTFISRAIRRVQNLEQRILENTFSKCENEGPIRSLGDIITECRNGMFISRPGVTPNGVPILRISAVKSLQLNTTDIRYTAQDVPTISSRGYLLSPGDLLFTRYNGNPDYVGACAVVPYGVGELTYPDKLIRVKVDPNQALPEFVAMACSTGLARKWIRQSSKTTAGQAGISGSELKKTPIPLPSLGSQAARVAQVNELLGSTSRLRNLVETAVRRTALTRRALLAEAFAGRLVPQDPSDEPASVLLERIRAERAAAVPAPRRGRRPKATATGAVPGPRRSGEIEAVPEGVQDELGFGDLGGFGR